MDDLRQLYGRVDARARGLSRVSYALVMGLVTVVALLAVGLLVFEDVLLWAAPVGVGMAVLYYAMDPNTEN